MNEGVILTKKPRKPRSAATILATSYSPAEADAADAAHKYEVGVDEAGRGPLFGRVYTGAVILPPPPRHSTFRCLKTVRNSLRIRKSAKWPSISNRMR